MKIGQPSEILPVTTQNSPATTARNAQANPAAAKADRNAPGVGVTVSELARTMEQGADAPEVDMGKVNAVRQAIEQKTYVVNAGAIADKLLANAREMLNRTTS